MQFRRWLRDGPRSERIFTGVVAILAVALLGWAVVPSSKPVRVTAGVSPAGGKTAGAGAGAGASTGTAADGSAPVGAGGGAIAGNTSAVGGGSAPNSPTAGGTSVGADAGKAASTCDNRATDGGVSENEVQVAVNLPDLGSANPTFGLPTQADWQKMYNALISYYNDRGGIQCRKIVPHYYYELVLDNSAGRANCLQMQQDGVFMLMNQLFANQNRTCTMEAGIPTMWFTSPETSWVHDYYPYVFSYQADYDRLFRDYVHGAQQLGFFDGLAKLGVLEQTCFPDETKALIENLHQIGISDNQMSQYNYGCPSSPKTTDQDTAAVLQFRREGVTHVVSASRGSIAGIGDAANAQGWKPKYAIVDDQQTGLANSANPPWSSNLDGTLVIAKGGEGAETTPGATYNQATADCAAIAKGAGLPGPTETAYGGNARSLAPALFGVACVNLKMLVAMGNVTTPLTRAGLASGLATLGQLELSYPAGVGDFHDPSNPTGNRGWRPAQYHSACNCVQVLDLNWRPEF
jgi:hypothetical protein